MEISTAASGHYVDDTIVRQRSLRVEQVSVERSEVGL